MSHLQLSDVQSTNLHHLLAIRLGVERDAVATCRKFALDAELARQLQAASIDQIWTLVAALGDATLFLPREDFVALLNTPSPLIGALAAVQPPPPNTTNKA
ncbi:hypothetical protein P3W85_36895 [Cupriavidus basilensis]|uniref:Uncharacterized protein n=1 Tax=Cupriavidus basilensis TaxID=68895 RepID=A0ABT6B0R1_9BURK|nr:hypothetical protein [Cupriavidus basilensis]MDF3838471.1 hypothetical protein [Cupriavidus basilensis]